ncbi:MAG: gliding motility-associated C-terminal domain-containing protein, partial [Bacteroidota bacterium]|nr:gliding motility-associated C-terminal domain-containing protein [Bacteroidota bacterium]
VTQPPALILTASGDSVCPGQSGTITANGSGGIPPYTYVWSGGPNPNSQTQSVLVTSSTTYTVTITDAGSCTTTATSTVSLNPSPSAAFTSNAVNGVLTLSGPGSQICFTGPSNVTSWFWDLNGVSTSTLQSPCVPITAANVGSYCATLAVTNSFNCIDTASVCVEINNVYYSIPNIFTPDQDGVNDGFLITNMGMETVRCKIYNRWGELMYEWDNPAGYWNGQALNGNDAVDGVYYYTAYMIDFQGKIYDESGFVQLIRKK